MSPMNRSDYPANWRGFSLDIRWTRAKGRCECAGECRTKHDSGRCERVNGVYHHVGEPEGELGIQRRALCVLTVAHLNAKDGPCRCVPLCALPEHVKAMCQGCHLRYDHEQHQLNASDTRDRKRGQLRLPLGKENA